jgi:transcriptional regulator with XRE-family HTH domain
VEELRHIREERSMSQADLAAASGVDRATINQVEGGRRSPTLATLYKLAVALGVEAADLIPPKRQARLFQPEERRGPTGPEEHIPESAGQRIHVRISDDLSTEPARVEITYESFLDVLRRHGLTRRAAEEAFEEFEGLQRSA